MNVDDQRPVAQRAVAMEVLQQNKKWSEVKSCCMLLRKGASTLLWTSYKNPSCDLLYEASRSSKRITNEALVQVAQSHEPRRGWSTNPCPASAFGRSVQRRKNTDFCHAEIRTVLSVFLLNRICGHFRNSTNKTPIQRNQRNQRARLSPKDTTPSTNPSKTNQRKGEAKSKNKAVTGCKRSLFDAPSLKPSWATRRCKAGRCFWWFTSPAIGTSKIWVSKPQISLKHSRSTDVV